VNALRALEPYARAWKTLAPEGERCQLCARAIEEDHAHLVDLERRALVCSCAGCARLLAQPGTAGGRYRLVPARVLVDPGFRLGDTQWAALQIPVRLAFVFFNSRLSRWVVMYPSPAGAAEADLAPEAERALAERTRLVGEAQPDVEAVLLYGRRGHELEGFLAPIDACYRLVGRVRLHWRGFHGGDFAWREIEAFFSELRARARPIEPPPATKGEDG